MTLDKIIYLSCVTGRVQTFMCCVLAALVVIALMFLVIGACEYSYSDDAIERFKSAKKYAKLALFIALPTVLLPSRWEMLSMTIIKGYKVDTIYQMTKDELRDNINYFINSLDKMESMKND